MGKADLIHTVIRGHRENNIGAVMFHQAVGQMLGLNVTDMKCLDIIVMKGSASPSQLAQLTGLSTGSATAMIDRLEKRELIKRRPNPDDRRGTTVVLTAGATQRLPRLFASMAKAMEALVSSYSESELEILLDFFRRISRFRSFERSLSVSSPALFTFEPSS